MRSLTCAAAVSVSIIMSACGGSGGGTSSPSSPSNASTPPAPVVTVTGITVTGPGCTTSVTKTLPFQGICSTDTTAGGTLQLKATAQLSNSTTEDVTSKATWTSSYTNVATVNTSGLVTLKSAGETDILATYEGKLGGQTVRVQPAGPKTQFGAGQYLVNKDIAAGRYFSDPGTGCYWERQSGLGGNLGDIIANDFVGYNAGQYIVDILASDLAFETDSDCGTWYNSVRRGLATNITPGIWLVGSQIKPGTYRATVKYGCYWERLRNFTGELSGVIANDFVSSAGTQLVEIRASDVGFNTDDDCGEWTPVSSFSEVKSLLAGTEEPSLIEHNRLTNRQTGGFPLFRLRR